MFYQSINLGRLKLSVLFKPRVEENKVALVKQKSSAIYSFKEVCSCLETASKKWSRTTSLPLPFNPSSPEQQQRFISNSKIVTKVSRITKGGCEIWYAASCSFGQHCQGCILRFIGKIKRDKKFQSTQSPTSPSRAGLCYHFFCYCGFLSVDLQVVETFSKS